MQICISTPRPQCYFFAASLYAVSVVFHTVCIKKFLPLVARAESESVGARQECLGVLRLAFSSHLLPIAGSERAAAMVHDFLASEQGWGAAAKRLMEASAIYAHRRHNAIAGSIGGRIDFFVTDPVAVAVLERRGDLRQAEVLFTRQLRAVHDHRKEKSSTSLDLAFYFLWSALSLLCLDCDNFPQQRDRKAKRHAFRSSVQASGQSGSGSLSRGVGCGCVDLAGLSRSALSE